MDISLVFKEIDNERMRYSNEHQKHELKGDLETAKAIWTMRLALDVLKLKLKEMQAAHA